VQNAKNSPFCALWERLDMMIPEPIAEFDAFVARVQTMADGSPRVVLDMSEDRIDLLTTLAKTRTNSIMLTVLVFDKDEWQEYIELCKDEI
jgi:hypothetical protein